MEVDLDDGVVCLDYGANIGEDDKAGGDHDDDGGTLLEFNIQPTTEVGLITLKSLMMILQLQTTHKLHLIGMGFGGSTPCTQRKGARKFYYGEQTPE